MDPTPLLNYLGKANKMTDSKNPLTDKVTKMITKSGAAAWHSPTLSPTCTYCNKRIKEDDVFWWNDDKECSYCYSHLNMSYGVSVRMTFDPNANRE